MSFILINKNVWFIHVDIYKTGYTVYLRKTNGTDLELHGREKNSIQ